jgi:hypothetical protein
MRSHLHNRVSKIEQAMTAGRVRENEQDPSLVSFMACFGIPAEECPRGVTAIEWLTEACKGACILGVAKSP